jgi:hypothetical protein
VTVLGDAVDVVAVFGDAVWLVSVLRDAVDWATAIIARCGYACYYGGVGQVHRRGMPSSRIAIWSWEYGMLETDTAEFQRRYGGRYVASVDGKVIVSGATYRDLSEQLDRVAVKWDDLIIEYVEPPTSVSVY